MTADFDKKDLDFITYHTYDLETKPNGVVDWVIKRVARKEAWSLVQTNCDAEWTGDDIDGGRFYKANDKLARIGRKRAQDLQTVRERVLLTQDVLFTETVYNTLLCPASGFFDTQRFFTA